MPHSPALGQYFTPVWGAETLYEQYFRHLTSDDVIVDPAAGNGNFLLAIPDNGPEALGVELDPVLADEARARTGRTILTGDFRTVTLPKQPTAFIGNASNHSSLSNFSTALESYSQMVDKSGSLEFSARKPRHSCQGGSDASGLLILRYCDANI